MNSCTNERMYDWMYKWMNGWMNGMNCRNVKVDMLQYVYDVI